MAAVLFTHVITVPIEKYRVPTQWKMGDLSKQLLEPTIFFASNSNMATGYGSVKSNV